MPVMRPTFVPLATCSGIDAPRGPECARALNHQAIARLMRDDAATLVNRGTARKEAGDLEGARADLDLALERMARQQRPAILHKRGGVRVLQADFRGAVDDYNEALAAEPDNVVYYISRGNAR